ncbi:unnamed protein product [Orchesella dallaii]|uniref:C2H2-type domain-containing protein n=1 Tax=Orchesella dallaii TaxID=48710 RepID=A0ABP1PKZ7_9HEXA
MQKLDQIGSGAKVRGTNGDHIHVRCPNGQSQTGEGEPKSNVGNGNGNGPNLDDFEAVEEGQVFVGQLALEKNCATPHYQRDTSYPYDYMEDGNFYHDNTVDDVDVFLGEKGMEEEPLPLPENGDGTQISTTGASANALVTGDHDDRNHLQTFFAVKKGSIVAVNSLNEELAILRNLFLLQFSAEAEVEHEQEDKEPLAKEVCQQTDVKLLLLDVSIFPEFNKFLEQNEVAIASATLATVEVETIENEVGVKGENLLTPNNIKIENNEDEEVQQPLKKMTFGIISETLEGVVENENDKQKTVLTNANKNHSHQKQLNLVPPKENNQTGIGEADVNTIEGSGYEAVEGENDFTGNRQENSNNLCPRCQKDFEGKNLLQKHLQSTHKLGTEHKCSICAMPFYGKWTHKSAEELEEAEGHDGKIPAQIKKKLNTSKSSSVKKNPRPVAAKKKCEICEKLVKNLTGHKRQCHTKMEDRHIVCPICTEPQRKFVTKSRLRKHMLTAHEKGELLKCGDCPEKFTSSVMRKAHYQKVHAKILSFPCPHCDKEFAWETSVGRHVKQVHKNGGK